MQIALLRFSKEPWDIIVQQAFKKALLSFKIFDQIDEIYGYPDVNKFYDLIILCGVRLIPKYKLNGLQIKKQCKYLCDMGDEGKDGRKNIEDIYFYFIPCDDPIYPHYKFLPKFVNDDLLYPEHDKNEPLTIFIDHYHNQNQDEEKLSQVTINYIFDQLKKAPFPLRTFYLNSKGIEINSNKPEIISTKKPKVFEKMDSYKYLPFEEIANYYRKTHVFFPTHRETQGMVAQEIGACGGLTVMQYWMYPKKVQEQFPKIFYFPNYNVTSKDGKNNNETIKKFFIQKKIFYLNNIDWKKIKLLITEKNIKFNRKLVLQNCSFNLFKRNLYFHLQNLFNN